MKNQKGNKNKEIILHDCSKNSFLKIINDLMKNGFNLPTIISPLAHVSKYAKIGQGNIIMHGSIINAGSKTNLLFLETALTIL